MSEVPDSRIALYRMRVDELDEALTALLPYAQHADSCGDEATYFNREHYCGCGLEALKDFIATLMRREP